jgi:hypothetical protein
MELTDSIDRIVEYTGNVKSYKKALDDNNEPYFKFGK